MQKISRDDLLYYVRLLAGVLTSVTAGIGISKELQFQYSKNPSFFRSKKALQIYAAVIVLIVIALVIWITIIKDERDSEEKQQFNF